MKKLIALLALSLVTSGCGHIIGNAMSVAGNGQTEARVCPGELTTTTERDGTVTEVCSQGGNYRMATGAEGSEGLWQMMTAIVSLILGAIAAFG